MINSGGDYYGCALDVILDDAFVGIQIRVPGVRAIFNRVLSHADARQPRLVK